MRPSLRCPLQGLASIGLALILSSGGWFYAVTSAATLPVEEAPVLARLGQAHFLAGANGQGDQRDADLAPVLAFDPSSQRFLAVWLTARAANSPTDGLDLYGRFFSEDGTPLSVEFRISDANTVARNGPPSVVASDGRFLVAWTRRGPNCEVVLQLVADDANLPDQLAISGQEHQHSPGLARDANGHILLAYVAGDDYQPPSFRSADAADCGDSAASSSRIQASEVVIDGSDMTVGVPIDVSGGWGAFRPRVAAGSGERPFLVSWEDRREAGSDSRRFDVVARLLIPEMPALGSEMVLASGSSYARDEGVATWTPRPAVTSGSDRWLVVWFDHEEPSGVDTWAVRGRFVDDDGPQGDELTVALWSYARSHLADEPIGFLDVAHIAGRSEFLVGLAAHHESLWGYLSTATIQRVSEEGRLLRMDGSARESPGIGNAVDFTLDDQIGISLASLGTGALIGFAKHAPGEAATDFDIWGAALSLVATDANATHVPLVLASAPYAKTSTSPPAIRQVISSGGR